MTEFDVDLTAPLDDSLVKDFLSSSGGSGNADGYHLQQQSSMNQQMSGSGGGGAGGGGMQQHIQINRQQMQMQSQSLTQQQQIQQIKQHLQNTSGSTMSPANNTTLTRVPSMNSAQIAYQQQQQSTPKSNQIMVNSPTSIQSIQSQANRVQFQNATSGSPQQANSQQAILIKNSNGQYQLVTSVAASSQQMNANIQHQKLNQNNQQSGLALNIQQQNQQNLMRQQQIQSQNSQQQQQQQQHVIRFNTNSQTSSPQPQQHNQINQQHVQYHQQQQQSMMVNQANLNTANNGTGGQQQQQQNLVVITASSNNLGHQAKPQQQTQQATFYNQSSQQQIQNQMVNNKSGIMSQTPTIINIASAGGNASLISASQQQAASSNNGATSLSRAGTSATPTSSTNLVNTGVNQYQQQYQQTQQQQTQQIKTSGTVGSGSNTSPIDLLRCLRKFLHTLLELANQSLPEKYPLVRSLIQDLLDNRIDPETFIKRIQIEKNPPSPSLVPFLQGLDQLFHTIALPEFMKAMQHWRGLANNQSYTVERFFEMISATGSTTIGGSATTGTSGVSTGGSQHQPIVITSTQNSSGSGSTPIIANLSQNTTTVLQQPTSSVLILNRTPSNQSQPTPIQPSPQQQQSQLRPAAIKPQPQQQTQQQTVSLQPQQQQTQQSIGQMPMHQIQQQLKYQQIQQGQAQGQQMKGQPIVISNLQAVAGQQSSNQGGQYIIQSTGGGQFQTIATSATGVGQITQQNQLQQQAKTILTQTVNTASSNSMLAQQQQIAKGSTMPMQTMSHQTMYQQKSPSSMQHQQQQQQRAMTGSPMASSPLSMTSPIKTEQQQIYTTQQTSSMNVIQQQQQQQQHYTQGIMQPPSQTPKTVTRIVKAEIGGASDYQISQPATTTIITSVPKLQTSMPGSTAMATTSHDYHQQQQHHHMDDSLMHKPMVNLDQIKNNKDEKFLTVNVLHKKLAEIARKHKLDDVSADVATLISQATQEYLRNMLEKLNVISQHRLDLSIRTNDSYEMTNDVKSQIKFIEELDKIDKKKKDEAEREKLLKAAKSRSKGEDHELNKLKQKAKEVIQAESDEIRRQESNKTALAAIGSRKKRKTEEPGGGGGAGGGGSGSGSGLQSQRAIYRPKIKRVNIRDLIFLMEQEKEFRRSAIYYKALSKF